MQIDTKYSVGDAYLDAQHALLLHLVRSLSLSVESGESAERVIRLLNEVTKYAEYHFVSEENYMHEIGYPDIAEHTRIHSEMLAELSEATGQAHEHLSNVRKVSDFLHVWLEDHIVNEDGRLAAYAAPGKRKAA